MSRKAKTFVLISFILIVSTALTADSIPQDSPFKSFVPDLRNSQVWAPESRYTSTPTPTLSPTPVINLLPRTLMIPKLGLEAPVEHLGVTSTGQMSVPRYASNAGWYMFGSKPSEYGNAVITGHYDTPTGAPAIFYYLANLEKGDSVMVESMGGDISEFTVTGKDSIVYTAFPNDFVFNAKAGTNLNLITCGGIWNAKERSYNQRIVVYTSFVESR